MPDDHEQFSPPKAPVHVYSFAELRSTGMLWYLNHSALHARGFAIALHFDNGTDAEPTGWSIVGDGSEPIAFLTKEMAEDYGIAVKSPVDADAHFRNVEALLASQRQGPPLDGEPVASQ